MMDLTTAVTEVMNHLIAVSCPNGERVNLISIGLLIQLHLNNSPIDMRGLEIKYTFSCDLNFHKFL